MKLELTKGHAGFNVISWVAKGLITTKGDLRNHVIRVFKDEDLFIATNGERMHIYDHKGLFDELKDGYYEVIKNTKTKVILVFDKAKDQASYPDIKDFLKIKLDFPEDCFSVEWNDAGSGGNKAYADILRNMVLDSDEHIKKANPTNYINYSFLEDVLKIGQMFEVYNENENQPVYFKSDNLFAIIMPIRP